MINPRLRSILFGLDDAHVIVEPTSGQLLHPEALIAFERLQQDARAAGFEPKVVSGFRDFERQRAIWNGKACGQRALLGNDGEVLELAKLSPEQLIFAILRWSALPGGSRHHWGTDFDVIDANAVDESYRPQLTPQEVVDGGVFGPFHTWLDQCIDSGKSYGLFRPYARDRGGVAPERWHLSYAPRACEFQQLLTPHLLSEQLQRCELMLGTIVCENIEDIFQRFVAVPNGPCAQTKIRI